MTTTSLYRNLLREVHKSSISSSSTRNRTIQAHFRSLFDKKPRHSQSAACFVSDIDNATVFMHSQRTHKELLERYNPLFDLTAEERIEATARRVGLNMPLDPK